MGFDELEREIRMRQRGRRKEWLVIGALAAVVLAALAALVAILL